MDYAEQFFESLRALNEFVFHRAVLKYQWEIIEQGSFSLISPWTGESLLPTACHIANNGDPAHGNLGIAYRFDCKHSLWLLASSIKDGFPITEAYSASLDTSLWALGEVHAHQNKPWKDLLLRVAQGDGSSSLAPNDLAAPVVLIGHPNFAHNLWNELAALHAYAKARRDTAAVLELKTIYEPLAPIECFTGNLPVSVSRLMSFEALVGLQKSIVTRLGSTQIPVGLRQQVGSLLGGRRDRELTDDWAASLRDCGPVIWLSARLDARTLDNQTDFLTSLITRIAVQYPQAGFILDGFSFANDFDSEIYQQDAAGDSQEARYRGGFLASADKSREQDVTAYVTELQNILGGHLPNPVINVSGMNLTDAIYLAGMAHYYVCHAGTLQHKIAWLHNTPGIVHSNIAGLEPGVPVWLADQLEGGLHPGVIPCEYVKDLDSIRTANQVERNRDYHLRDVESVVGHIMADIQTKFAR